MSRVIQDSDDELDDDFETDVHQPEKTDASSKQSTSDASSTEALQRQIEAAHRAHLQSQFPVNDGHSPVYNLEANHQKRRNPNGFDFDNTPSGEFVLQGGHATYGKSLKEIFGSSPAGQLEARDTSKQTSRPADTTNEMDWMLGGTIREAYVQHNPNTMFPEPSSTVPNATLTQQRILEGVLAPALLGSDPGVERALFQPDASIPWSEYLKSPIGTGEQPRSSTQEPYVTQTTPAAISEPSLQEYDDIPQSQRNRRGSLALVGSPSIDDGYLGLVDAQDSTTVLNGEHQPKNTLLQAPLVSTIDGSTQEELSSSHRQSCKKRPSPAPTLDDDLANLGLPKEQYKPRPSRSRSLKVDTQESIDYSMRPEKVTKRNRRRRTTNTSTETSKLSSTPDRIQQICDMGFTPSTGRRALNQNNGDVTQAVDWLITNKAADDELAFHTLQMSTNGSRQGTANTAKQEQSLYADRSSAEQMVPTDIAAESEATIHVAASAEPDIITSVVDPRSPAKVQVVIPAKSPQIAADTSTVAETTRTKAKRRKTTLDDPEPTAKGDIIFGTKPEKKRGRGRPKKAAKIPLPKKTVQNDQKEDPQEQVCGSPLQTVDVNSKSATVQHQVIGSTTAGTTKSSQGTKTSQSVDISSATATSNSTPERPVLPDRPEVSPITPEHVKKAAPHEQPSNNKAKVPYRVGLSKRARIAPLLRTMKK